MKISYKFQAGIILATNLIMLLLVTLIANALFKNAFIESQMTNHQYLSTVAKSHINRGFYAAQKTIENMLNNNADLMVSSSGYYPLDHKIHIDELRTLPKADVFLIGNTTRFIIIYLGESHKRLAVTSVEKYHLFKIIVYANSWKGTELSEQQLFSVAIIDP